jgi:hypothetical protein
VKVNDEGCTKYTLAHPQAGARRGTAWPPGGRPAGRQRSREQRARAAQQSGAGCAPSGAPVIGISFYSLFVRERLGTRYAQICALQGYIHETECEEKLFKVRGVSKQRPYVGAGRSEPFSTSTGLAPSKNRQRRAGVASMPPANNLRCSARRQRRRQSGSRIAKRTSATSTPSTPLTIAPVPVPGCDVAANPYNDWWVGRRARRGAPPSVDSAIARAGRTDWSRRSRNARCAFRFCSARLLLASGRPASASSSGRGGGGGAGTNTNTNGGSMCASAGMYAASVAYRLACVLGDSDGGCGADGDVSGVGSAAGAGARRRVYGARPAFTDGRAASGALTGAVGNRDTGPGPISECLYKADGARLRAEAVSMRSARREERMFTGHRRRCGPPRCGLAYQSRRWWSQGWHRWRSQSSPLSTRPPSLALRTTRASRSRRPRRSRHVRVARGPAACAPQQGDSPHSRRGDRADGAHLARARREPPLPTWPEGSTREHATCGHDADARRDGRPRCRQACTR